MERLEQRTRVGLQVLHSGVSDLVLTDFPDHGNVGDSAIALGERKFWDDSDIRLTKVQSRSTLTRGTLLSHLPVAVHGGGNIGGLYPEADEHRFQLASALPSSTLLIQEPQTVHFTSDERREAFAERFAARPNTRIAVRDHRSAQALQQLMDDVVLSPDPVHMLGQLESPEPTRDVLYLRRDDSESAGQLRAGRDWPRDPWDLSALRWWSNRSVELPPMKLAFQRGSATWMAKAERRLARGIQFLSQGETIVTDRLHAMLLGLQMGRKVIATDNKYGKLSAYAQTWLSGFESQLDLRDAS